MAGCRELRLRCAMERRSLLAAWVNALPPMRVFEVNAKVSHAIHLLLSRITQILPAVARREASG
jgi:hypothetical protein